AADWEKGLDELRKADPDGYVHWVKLYADKGHWLDREDAAAIPWMAKFNRNPIPRRVAWRQANTTHPRFYWLAVEEKDQKAGAEETASYDKQQIEVIAAKGVTQLVLRLNDRMLDLDQPIVVSATGKPLSKKLVPRTIGVLARTLNELGDPAAVFSGEVTI